MTSEDEDAFDASADLISFLVVPKFFSLFIVKDSTAPSCLSSSPTARDAISGTINFPVFVLSSASDFWSVFDRMVVVAAVGIAVTGVVLVVERVVFAVAS